MLAVLRAFWRACGGIRTYVYPFHVSWAVTIGIRRTCLRAYVLACCVRDRVVCVPFERKLGCGHEN